MMHGSWQHSSVRTRVMLLVSGVVILGAAARWANEPPIIARFEATRRVGTDRCLVGDSIDGSGLVGAIAPPVPARNYAVALGTIEVKAGSIGVPVHKKALDVSVTPGTASPEAVGDIKNLTGRKLDDVTIIIENKGTGGGIPPQAASVTVRYGGGTETAQFNGAPSGPHEAIVKFDGGESGIDGLPAGNTAEVEIELDSAGSTPPSEFFVSVTGSIKDKPSGAGATVHADWLGAFDLDSVGTGSTLTLQESWHDRIVCDIRNTDRTKAISSLNCTANLPSGVAITSVTLQDADREYQTVPGSTTSINGSAFNVSGFTLTAGNCFELVVVYDAVPGGKTSLTVDAGFEE